VTIGRKGGRRGLARYQSVRGSGRLTTPVGRPCWGPRHLFGQPGRGLRQGAGVPAASPSTGARCPQQSSRQAIPSPIISLRAAGNAILPATTARPRHQPRRRYCSRRLQDRRRERNASHRRTEHKVDIFDYGGHEHRSTVGEAGEPRNALSRSKPAALGARRAVFPGTLHRRLRSYASYNVCHGYTGPTVPFVIDTCEPGCAKRHYIHCRAGTRQRWPHGAASFNELPSGAETARPHSAGGDTATPSLSGGHPSRSRGEPQGTATPLPNGGNVGQDPVVGPAPGVSPGRSPVHRASDALQPFANGYTACAGPTSPPATEHAPSCRADHHHTNGGRSEPSARPFIKNGRRGQGTVTAEPTRVLPSAHGGILE